MLLIAGCCPTGPEGKDSKPGITSKRLGTDPAMRLPTKRGSRKVTLQRAGDAGGAMRQVGTCGYTYHCYSETIASREEE